MDIQIHQLPHQINISSLFVEKLCKTVAADIGLEAKSCSVIFVDDVRLKEMHSHYLNDDTKTDVITFDLGEDKIEGEIYISVDRAIVQAESFKVSVAEEIVRLIIHGLLHLKGFDDRTEADRIVMKKEENRLVDKWIANKKR